MGNDGSKSRQTKSTPRTRPGAPQGTSSNPVPHNPSNRTNTPNTPKQQNSQSERERELTRSESLRASTSESPVVLFRPQSQQLLQGPIINDQNLIPPNLDGTGYDVVIDIQKISDVTTGWPILVGDNIASALKSCTCEEDALAVLQLDQQSTVVGVFGLFNRGKTHVVNHLGRSNLASGKKIHTRGLSFIKPTKDIPVVFLDTAGTNSPVDRKYFEKLVQAHRDPLSEKKRRRFSYKNSLLPCRM